MTEILIRPEKPTNLKPDSWYEEYLKIENNYLLKHPEEQIKFDPEHGTPLKTIEEIKEFDVMADDNQSYTCTGFGNNELYTYEEMNTLKINKELLEQYRKELESYEIWKSIKDTNNIDNEDWREYSMIETSFQINKCLEALEQGYLVTAQLEFIYMCLDSRFGNEQSRKEKGTKIYSQFKFGNYQEELYNFIKQNTNWRNKSRDFKIYKEIQKGTLYSEIAERLDCVISTISKINKKVQSSINNLKGKFFEIEYEKYLKSLHKFRNSKIVRDGTPGKPDIYIIDKINNCLYVFSLKNLELNKKSFSIIKDKLKPEIKFAYNNSSFKNFKEVTLYLIVFDSLTEKIHFREVDYKNPTNINIYQ